jgi:hypothetical protein
VKIWEEVAPNFGENRPGCFTMITPHTSVLTQLFLTKCKMVIIPHPPYSPDLAPCDFLLFPKLKLKLKGRQFDTIEEIQGESQRVLDR